MALIGFIGAFVIPITGIVIGAIGLRQIKETGEGGRGLARAAIGIGILGTLFQIAFFALWLTLFTSAITSGGLIR